MDVVSSVIEKAKAPAFDEDIVLVERFLAGDRDVFEVLYSKYYNKVYTIARGILLDSEEAADTVQEVFTLLYRNLARFDRRSRFSTWLFRVAVNRSIQQARRNRNRSKNVALNEALGKPTPDDGNDIDPKIHETLAMLPPADRALLTLFYWEEQSLQDISEAIGCSLNAAKTRLYRARERFRQLYEGSKP